MKDALSKQDSKQPKIIPARSTVVEAFKIPEKLKVCAYCRVSSSSDEQLNSYNNQLKYYNEYIQNNRNWEFVGIYADEGISGTKVEKRTDFLRMIDDCTNGRIDMIITKSISRFSRNHADTVKYVRLLREQNVAVFFEQENINTLDRAGDILLNIISSLTEDEIRQLSDKVKWGNDVAMKSGVVFGNNNILGYNIIDGKLIINEDEAEIVRFVFDKYLEGYGSHIIAKMLTEKGFVSSTGKTKWSQTVVLGILKNEKYCGRLLTQKYYTTDYITHKRHKNRGEKTQYLFENNHDPIISIEDFEKVQEERKRRNALQKGEAGRKTKHTNRYAFSGRFVCSNCGNGFRRTVWHKGKPYERVVWECLGYARYGKDTCHMKPVYNDAVEQAFIKVFNEMKLNKIDYIKNLEQIIKKHITSSGFEKELNEVEENLKVIKRQIDNLVQLNIEGSIPKEIYLEKYQNLEKQYNLLNDAKTKIEGYHKDEVSVNKRLNHIDKILNQSSELKTFDEKLFKELICKVVIKSPTYFEFYLNDDEHIDIDTTLSEDEGNTKDEGNMKELALKCSMQSIVLSSYKCVVNQRVSKYSNNIVNLNDNVVEVDICVNI